MTTDAAVAALRRNRADTSAAKQQAVLAALDQLTAQGGELNISTVARAAGVSRQFVYTHQALRAAVANAADSVRDGQPSESTGLDVALYATILIAIVLFLPKGVFGSVRDRWRR